MEDVLRNQPKSRDRYGGTRDTPWRIWCYGLLSLHFDKTYGIERKMSIPSSDIAIKFSLEKREKY